MTAESRVADELLVEADLTFVYVSRSVIDRDFFDPAGFLQMLRVFGLYEVAVDSEGTSVENTRTPPGRRAGVAAQPGPLNGRQGDVRIAGPAVDRPATVSAGGRAAHDRDAVTWMVGGSFAAEEGAANGGREGDGSLFSKGRTDMRRRVVVTGVGCINPMGNDVETMWSGLKEGRSGVGDSTVFDADEFPTHIAAEVKNWDITDTGEDPDIWRYRARHTRFAAGAAKEAIQRLRHARHAHSIPRALASTSVVAKATRTLPPSRE